MSETFRAETQHAQRYLGRQANLMMHIRRTCRKPEWRVCPS